MLEIAIDIYKKPVRFIISLKQYGGK